MNSLSIPSSALAYHLIALGKTGSGKSSKLRVLVEGLLDEKAPVCILDPKGDWWGLKSSADAKRDGYALIIFGGEHADVPINAHSGAHVAELVATGNRPCIIDLGGWMVGERTRFFIDFASTLFKMARGARHLVIDEVHNFAPQGKVHDPDAGKMLHWANRLASEGRGKGITLLAASQRPQKVSKDFVTSCETLIACKVIHKLDRDAIKDWIDGCADPAKGREVIADLAQLKKPEAWVWCPEIDFGPARITFPMFKTYDSFKPQPADGGKLKGWASVDLEDVKAKLSKVVEEAKANDPKALRARIAQLETALRGNTQTSPRAVDEAYAKGVAAGRAESARHYNDFRACDELLKKVGSTMRELLDPIFDQAQQCEDRAQQITEHSNHIESRRAQGGMVPKRAYLVGSGTTEFFVPKPAATDSHARSMRSPTTPRAASASYNGTGNVGGDSLSKGERAMLTAVAQFGSQGIDHDQLLVLTGYKATSIKEYRSRLRSKRLVNEAWPMTATAEGISALGAAFEPLPTGAALLAHWRSRLSAGELKVLDVVVSHYPDSIDSPDLCQRTEYKPTSIKEYVSRLKARRLVTRERGQVKASAELFA